MTSTSPFSRGRVPREPSWRDDPNDFTPDPQDQAAAREEDERHQRYLALCRNSSLEAQGVGSSIVPEVGGRLSTEFSREDSNTEPPPYPPANPSSYHSPVLSSPVRGSAHLPPVEETEERSQHDVRAPKFASLMATVTGEPAGPQVSGHPVVVTQDGQVVTPGTVPAHVTSKRPSADLSSPMRGRPGRAQHAGMHHGVNGDGKPLASHKEKTSQLLAQPAQQLVVRFEDVCSWADMGGLGDSKGPLGDLTKPFTSAAKAVRSGARRVSDCVRPSSSTVTPDVETGSANPTPALASAAPPGAKRSSKWRQILHHISGTVLPGQVLALMGPSGSGKTSLLSILGGRAPSKLKLAGSVTVNRARLSKATRRRIGFVLQDDVLYETLTVHETLTFSGLLRLPKTMTRAEKMERVETVMSVLGLAKARDTIIGGYFRRGISGGERKRVSVGQELLINPSVLLLDEPTSGLDSTTALHLVQLLHELASGGRAILTTIHQPSSRLYHHLDKVMLLAEGHVMFMGDALLAVDWFEHLGFPLPYGINLADHLLDCAMGEVAYDPSAPGALGTQQYGEEGEEENYAKTMHGKTAVHALYTTFEAWYAAHPAGFTLASVGSDALARTRRASSDASTNGHNIQHSSAALMNTAESGIMLSALLDGVKLLPPGVHRPPHRVAALLGSEPGVAALISDAKAAPSTTTAPSMSTTATSITGKTPEQPTGVVGRVRQAFKRCAGQDQWAPAWQRTQKGGVRDGDKVVTGGDTPWLEQVAILWRRAVKVRRFESLSGQQLCQMIAVAVITGLLWWQRANQDDVAASADVTGLLFFEMVFVAFRSLFGALFTFPNEFRILSKERPSGAPRLSAYYVARTLADLPIELMLPTLFVVIIYFFGGLRLAAGAFFSNLFSILLIVLTGQSWGLLIGGTFMDPKTAQTVTTVVMLTLMLVGGFYVRDVQVWIGWLKYLSFLYWGNNLLLKIEFRGRSLTDCAVALPGQPCPQVNDISGALRLPVDVNDSVYPEVLVLLGMLLLLRIVTWYVLRWKVSGSQRGL